MEEFQMEKPKGSKKGLWIVVIIAVAIIFGIAGYFFGKSRSAQAPETPIAETAVIDQADFSSPIATVSSTDSPAADEIANWKTYTNDTYGFSFKYPNGWSESSATYPGALVNIGIDTPSRHETNKCHEDGCDSPNSIKFEYYSSYSKIDEQGGYTSLANYLDINTGLDTKRYSSNSAHKINTYDGYKAIAGQNTFNGGTYYFIERNNGEVMSIWFFGRDKEWSNSIGDQILSTFQFTK